ncbi:hypothetical protein JCM10450v2_005306 [Rhodotorula kratochvilovae]
MDRLPTELLFAILDLAAPLDMDAGFDESFYRLARLAVLSCLSKTYYAIMRPLLYRSVWVGADTVGRFRRAVKECDWEAARWVRSISTTPYLKENTFNRLGKLLHKLPNVEEIRLGMAPSSGCEVDLAELARAPNLRRLAAEVQRGILTGSPRFDSLVELSLHEVAILPDDLAILLAANTTPSLKALYIGKTTVTLSTLPTLDPASLNRLDVLQVGLAPHHFRALPSEFQPVLPSPDLSALSVPILLSLPLGHTSLLAQLPRKVAAPSSALHLRIDGAPTRSIARTPSDALVLRLSRISTFLRSAPLGFVPRSVSLPAGLHPSRPLPGAADATRDELLCACEEKGVRVRWRAEEGHRADWVVDRGVWDDARREREREREAQGKEEEEA